jgi:FAD/FMN-containing dehydrogenase
VPPDPGGKTGSPVVALSRRELLDRVGRGALLVAGAGGLGGLSGCGTTRHGDDLRRLTSEVSGPVLVPGERGYGQARLLFNPRFDGARPRAIVCCRTAQDVAATVGFARDRGIPLAARSGGHSFGGYSSPDGGIVVDVSGMRGIRVAADRRSATLGPGVLNMDISSTLGGVGLAVPTGTCPTVGVPGLTLGGGFGYSSRKLGLTADHLLELELVLASAERVTCSPQRRPDLFWASRGGGGGNFGIATSFRFRLHPVGEISVYDLTWRWHDAAAVVGAWQRWAPDAPDELFSTCALSRAGGHRPQGPTIRSQGQYFGSPARLSALLEPLESAARPVKRQVASASFRAAQERWAECTADHCARQAANPYAVKTAFFRDPIPAAGITAAIDQLERWPGSVASSPTVGIELNSWGGAIADVPSSATAFVHRDARVLAIYGTTWSPHDRADLVTANRAWLEQLWARMRPYASGSAYQNLIDPDLGDWAQAYYGSNYPRLVWVKRRYDPHNVFHFQQSIGSQQ